MKRSIALLSLGSFLLLSCHKKAERGPQIPEWKKTVLLDQNGQARPLGTIRQPFKLIYFGYTRCAESCPVALASMVEASALLGSKGRKLALVFISIDPNYDTPERLRSYVAGFRGRRILAFTASPKRPDALKKLMAAFGILSQKKGARIQHTPFLYLLSKDSHLIRSYSAGITARTLRTELEKVLY